MSFKKNILGSTWAQEMVWLLANDLDYETARNTIQVSLKEFNKMNP